MSPSAPFSCVRLAVAAAFGLCAAACQAPTSFDSGAQGPAEEHLLQVDAGHEDPLGRPMVRVEFELLRLEPGATEYELVQETAIVSWEGSLGSLSVLDQQAYVARFEVEIAEDSAIADPVVEVLNSGWTVEILPHRSPEGLWGGALKVHESELLELREYVTTLGSHAVTIQIPETRSRSRSTALLPNANGHWTIGLGPDEHAAQWILDVRMTEQTVSAAPQD
ncbi:MAG TPA: hypothetical protein VGC54_05545 [Planctomycetota bacterium]